MIWQPSHSRRKVLSLSVIEAAAARGVLCDEFGQGSSVHGVPCGVFCVMCSVMQEHILQSSLY